MKNKIRQVVSRILLLLVLAPRMLLTEEYDDPRRRAEEFEKQRAYPFEQIPDFARQNAFKQISGMLYSKESKALLLALQPEWKPIGPFDIGGRIKSVAFHPTKPGVCYSAGAAGGIWRSTNYGSWWEPIFDYENGIAFGSICIDQNNPNIIYAGTGESVIGGGVIYLGNGMYKSTDEGTSWTLIGLTEVGAFSKVYVHPKNSNLIVAGATIRKQGFYKSTDAGKNWFRTFDKNVTDVSINPISENEFLIGVNSEGVYYSSDGGNSWELRNNGIQAGIGRVSVQFAPSDPNIVYALVETNSLGFIYRSTNKGKNWTLVYQGDQNFFRGQGFYDNFIEVHPTNPNLVLAGGIDVFRTTDGKTWNNVTNGYSGGTVHVDQHCAAFSPINPNLVLLGNDGGVYFSSDAGINWVRRNSNLQVTQFYGFDIDHSKVNTNFGGTQDNGTLAGENDDWGFIAGGDGFRTAVDYTSPNIIYGQSTPNGQITPFRLDLKTGSYSYLDKGIDFSDGVWDPPLVIDPILNYILYYGRSKLYVSYNYGSSWERIKTPSTSGRFTAIDISPLNNEIIMAGTSSGDLIISTDAGENWQKLNDNGIVTRWITDIAFSNQSEGTAYVTFSGFFAPHIFKTTDYGKTWLNLSQNFPDIPVNTIVLHPLNENILFVGTDIGVFASFDGGNNWLPFGRNLPHSPVVDLKISKYSITSPTIPLRAATHGRGIWEVPVSTEVISEPEITSPTGGEIFISSTQQIIAWFGFTPPVRVEFSSNNGQTWSTIAENVIQSPFLWTIPNLPTEFARVRITSMTNENQSKISNTFTITLISKGSILRNFGVNFIPYGIAYDGKEGLWATSFQSNYLTRYNIHTFAKEKIIRLPGDSLFTDLSYDRMNHLIYVHRMNSTSGNGGVIIVVDTNGNVIRQFQSPAPSYPIGLELVDGKLIIGDRDKKDDFGRQILYVVDPINGKVETNYPNPYSKTYGPRGIAYDQSRFVYQIGTYFPNAGALSEAVAIRIHKDNLAKEIDRILLQTTTGLINARGIEYDPNDKNLWISDYNGNIYKIAGFELIVGVEQSQSIDKQHTAIEIFPNPANDYFDIVLKSNNFTKFIKIELFDSMGNKIETLFQGDVDFFETTHFTKYTDKLSSGIYFVRVISGNQILISKEVIVLK
ncbi:MAG: T9SS type A sorting domain-containing protein [Candidatus Kapaibacteriales bacterium]